MTTTTNTAQEYALLIKRELVALETLLENWAELESDLALVKDGEPSEMDSETLAECVAAQDELEITEWPDSPSELVINYLNDKCLEMVTLPADNDRDRFRVEILRTCGGPRCDISRDNNDGDAIEISVHDGGAHNVTRVYLSNLSDMIDQLAGGF